MYGTNDKGWSSRSIKHIVFHIQTVRYISITCMKTNYNRLIDVENVIIGVQ
jgi:predicted nucleic-acid-binding Zn-ribbon protein